MTALPEKLTHGRSRHGDDCDCTRCVGFRPQNAAAVRHGCHSILTLDPRAREIREGLAEIVPLDAVADTAALDTLSLTLAQAERASLVLANAQAREIEAVRNGVTVSPDERQNLRDLSDRAIRWSNSAHRWMTSLGLVTDGRLRLGLDLVRAQVLSDGRGDPHTRPVDLSRLSPAEIVDLEVLIEKASAA